MLRAGLLELKQQVNQYTMNPKAIPRKQLLGWMDNDTREWTDGVLTAACRQVVKEPLEVRSWIVCDGDIDPEFVSLFSPLFLSFIILTHSFSLTFRWIESLNSVLDDNVCVSNSSSFNSSFEESLTLTHSPPYLLASAHIAKWRACSIWTKCQFPVRE